MIGPQWVVVRSVSALVLGQQREDAAGVLSVIEAIFEPSVTTISSQFANVRPAANYHLSLVAKT